MNGLSHLEPDSEFVEVDPTGRYGRYNEILGRGASKIVYKAFDEYEGIEVAWNQVKLYDFLQSPEDLERLYCEIHLLKTLKHKNIMKFYTSWVDTANRNINFVTEMFTSGTLRQYRLKHKRVNIRAVKHWCRQILIGLLYLHSHDPPVIHRDLKCDNIFINGNQGEVKIGDLGLAAILRKPQAAHCVGTPEFMAPEIYEEAYNELVDIYSFGMCILEMVTFEYPYSECNNPAQIYKKVISGRKPDALYKVKDPEVREFVEKCLATVSIRLSAKELLNDPFLQIDDCESGFRYLDSARELDELGPLIRQPALERYHSNDSWSNGYPQSGNETPNEWMYPQGGYATPNEWLSNPAEIESSGIELFEHQEDESPGHLDISIKGKKREDDSIFLRIRIADQDGRIRNIYFPFDIEMDTALSVATEMVAELDITDQDVTKIADMIDGEIVALVPEWRPGLGIEETPHIANHSFCDNCASNFTSTGSLMEFLSHSSDAKDLKLLQCCRNGCASMHGRFEEISFQVDESEHHGMDGEPNTSSESESTHYHETWSRLESCEISPVASSHNHSDEEFERSNDSFLAKDENDAYPGNKITYDAQNLVRHLTGSPCSFSIDPSLYFDLSDCDYGKEMQQELRWLKEKYQRGMRELRDKNLGPASRSSSFNGREKGRAYRPVATQGDEEFHLKWSDSDRDHLPNLHEYKNKSCPSSETERAGHCETRKPSRSAVIDILPSCYTESFRPHSLNRTTSLPVDM